MNIMQQKRAKINKLLHKHNVTCCTGSKLIMLSKLSFVTMICKRQLIVSLAIICLINQIISIESNHIAHGQETMELHRRVKRALYDLPAGAELILGPNLRTTFTCDGLGYGYYADQDNECKIFHICQSFKMSDGSIYNNHWSFMCGNQTVFNQVTLACSHPEDAIPCESSRDFYHVNDYFGDVQAPSVRDADLVAAQDLVSRTYGARLSSNQQ